MNKIEKFKDFLQNTYIRYDFDIDDEDEPEWEFIGTMEDFLVMTESKQDRGLFYQMYHYGLHSVEDFCGIGVISRIQIISKSEYEMRNALWLSDVNVESAK